MIISFTCYTSPAKAQTHTPGNPVYVYIFWGDGCPHCAIAKPYIEELQDSYPEIVLKEYEIYYNAENQQFFASMAEKYDLEYLAVPTIFIVPYCVQGYSEDLNEEIKVNMMFKGETNHACITF